MESLFFSKLFARDTPDPQPTKVTGTYDVIAKCVYDDIIWTKGEIKKYNEMTGLLTSNALFYKLYKLLETDQANDLTQLKKSHEYDISPKNLLYQKQLVQTYKKHLRDLQHLFDCFQYNYNHGIFESHILDYRASKASRKESINSLGSLSSRTSLSSSTKSSAFSSISKLSTTTSYLAAIDENAPDNLLDPISFNLFNEPVITPSGITYEKCHLMDHLQKKGKYDPLTRAPLKENQLYPNLAIKDAVLEYINRQRMASQPPI